MEKKTIIVCCIFIGIILYNYPVFDNKEISYLLVFSFISVIIFAAAKLKNPTNDDYESVEKKSDWLENFDGIFEYEKNGFYVAQNNKKEFILWTDIVEVNSYNVPLQYSTRQSGLELITDKRKYEFEEEFTPGIVKLGNQLFENLPNWNLSQDEIGINNSGHRKINLFKKKHLS